MLWLAGGLTLFSLVMVVLTIGEQEPQDWYGNPIGEDKDGDEE